MSVGVQWSAVRYFSFVLKGFQVEDGRCRKHKVTGSKAVFGGGGCCNEVPFDDSVERQTKQRKTGVVFTGASGMDGSLNGWQCMGLDVCPSVPVPCSVKVGAWLGSLEGDHGYQEIFPGELTPKQASSCTKTSEGGNMSLFVEHGDTMLAAWFVVLGEATGLSKIWRISPALRSNTGTLLKALGDSLNHGVHAAASCILTKPILFLHIIADILLRSWYGSCQGGRHAHDSDQRGGK